MTHRSLVLGPSPTTHRRLALAPEAAERFRLPPLAAFLLLPILAMVGCGAAESGSIVGVYRVVSHTNNEAGCMDEGPEISVEPFFYIAERELLGSSFATLAFCASPEDCAEQQAMDGFGVFLDERLVNGWRGGATSSSSSGEDCSIRDQRYLVTDLGDMSVEYRHETRSAMFTVTPGECGAEDLVQQVEAQPCGELEVVRAERVSAP